MARYKNPPARRGGSRIGAPGYVKILRGIFGAGSRGMTWMSMARRYFGNRELSAQRALADMETVGLIHIGHWKLHVFKFGRRLPVAHYVFGPGQSAPHPGYLNGAGAPPKPRRKPRVCLIALQLAIEALKEDEYHGSGLAHEIGVSDDAARQIIKALYDSKFAFKADYPPRKDGGVAWPVYAFGINKQDVPKPPPLPKAEYWRRNNANKTAIRRALTALGKKPSSATSLGFTYSMAAEAAA